MKEEKKNNIEEYVSEIDDVIDECKNVNFVVTITKIQKVEIKKAVIVGLHLKDASGTILGIYVAPKNNNDAIKTLKNFKTDKKYKITGNIIIVDNAAINEFECDKVIFNKFNVKDGDKTLAIRTIESLEKEI